MFCTRCDASGFLNLHQIEDEEIRDRRDHDEILQWICDNPNHDVQVCDCCGDGHIWYGEPGEHYTEDDPRGRDGPYFYNEGLAECD